MNFALSNNVWYVAFQIHSVLTNVSLAYIWCARRELAKIIYYSKECLQPIFGGGISVIVLSFCRSGFTHTQFLEIISPKKTEPVYI